MLAFRQNLTLLLITLAGFASAEDIPVRLLAIGDMGTGSTAQFTVAEAMRQVCEQKGCDAVLGLGDNIYERGTEKPDSTEFVAKFLKPYSNLNLPFYMTLGNHDQTAWIPGDGAAPLHGDSQVAFAAQQQINASGPRWVMPSRYYQLALGQWQGRAMLDAFAIDSTPMAPYSRSGSPTYAADGPFVQAEETWLTQALATSHARWKVVFGHHPYRNNGVHGNAGNFDGMGRKPVQAGVFYKAFLERTVCGKADWLMSGHDHSLQVLKPVDSCGATRFLISGAAAKTYAPDRKPVQVELDAEGRPQAFKPTPHEWQTFGQLGFYWLQFDAEHVTLEAYTVSLDKGGAVLAFTRRY